ncbi:MAG TPA: LysR family transcriptional regulator [Polyangiaceae bacterium]|nr:LysR family transcriptional regulator [Polyangiaceae bacterium]
MNYDALFSFVVFVEHLNFTRAARALGLSQPALHVQVKRLGEAVGAPLYRREGRALALTPAGARLAAFGRETRERGARALAEARGEAEHAPVILASGQGAFLYLLGPALRRFPKGRWPLSLLTLPAEEALAHVRDARAHLAVVGLRAPPATEGLEALPLAVVGQRVLVPASHRLARRRSLSGRDLAGEPLVVAPRGSLHRAALEATLAEAGVAPQIAVEAPGWELMLQFARAGLGLAVVNAFCAAPRGTRAVPFVGMAPITYWLASRGAQAGGEGARRLHALIVETTRAPSTSATRTISARALPARGSLEG